MSHKDTVLDPFRNLTLRREFTEIILNMTGRNNLGHHQHLLNMLVDQHCIYVLTRKQVQEEGFIVESNPGKGALVRKANPAMTAMDSAMKNYMILLKELGLSPQQSIEFQRMASEPTAKSSKFSMDLPE